MTTAGDLEALSSILAEKKAAGPASETKIAELQASVGRNLPEDYLWFLRTYGAIAGEGLEIFGISECDPPYWRSAHLVGGLASPLLAIASNGIDHLYCLDLAEGGGTVSRIVAWGPGADAVEVSQSLEEFVRDMSSASLPY